MFLEEWTGGFFLSVNSCSKVIWTSKLVLWVKLQFWVQFQSP
jgi:hypothetical protein